MPRLAINRAELEGPGARRARVIHLARTFRAASFRAIEPPPPDGGVLDAYCTATMELPLGPRQRPHVETVTDQVLAYVRRKFGVTMNDLQSRRREQRLLIPRQESWWLLREHTLRSMAEIGRMFGRDHTTILHGVRRFEIKLESGRHPRPDFTPTIDPRLTRSL